MKRILVIGSCGSGKSTFARKLGERTGIEVIHLDRLYWRPNWVEPNKDEWKITVAGALEGDTWIIDGNYSGTLEMRIARSDTVIFLDRPRTLCVFRVVTRAIKYRRRTRPDMADGCNDRLNWEFIKWVWGYPKRSKPKVEAILAAIQDTKSVIRLRSSAETEHFLEKLHL